MEQLLLHLIGDYVTQSNWMATKKTANSFAAGIHALVYSLPFLLIGSWSAVAVICVTHFFIDRFRLARYVIWAKNALGASPSEWNSPELNWDNCKATGYSSQVPQWMSVWLMIIADNTMHLTINYLALRYL
ncbi:DUF3307 domain-containing protein [Geitlerinema calcuttense]|uniref:DUF3307 domain-containing protein n=1 Tax=Geitlerinema calcuttense NRMC-F 0142 TaxID=2922238 RepID=A0ABT7LV34_9CYAN|nr:DUF3307 domain-containing protein [Geitlerinema calcuttense]MDL5055912.1 DUF3307 domain-containing protein [Geitlerinema calcuttense NRMC-F 0142]